MRAVCSVFWILFVFLGGCASVTDRSMVLATVDGEPVTEGDLEYTLSISHRREDLSSAGTMDILQYVNKLINDLLIMQEARSIGYDKREDIRKKVDAFILTRSVNRLREEEILRKIALTEEEVRAHYAEYYEEYTLQFITTDSAEEATVVLDRLRTGEDFETVAKELSTDPSTKDGRVVVHTRKQLLPEVYEALRDLNPGQVSDEIVIGQKHVVVKVMDRKAAPADEFEKARPAIEKTLRKEKERKLSDEYLDRLRKKAQIWIDKDLLASITPPKDNEESARLAKDERPLARVDGSVVKVRDFAPLIDPHGRRTNEEILNGLIDIKLVDHEALSRHYEQDKVFQEAVEQYEDQLLRSKFMDEVIIPKVAVSDDDLQGCYEKYQGRFRRPVSYRLQQITVKTEGEADEVVASLRSGTDFSWLAKSRSIDSAAHDGGDTGWLLKEQMPPALGEAVEKLTPGAFSGVIRKDSEFIVVRLREITGGDIPELDKIQKDIYRLCFQDKLNEIYYDHVEQLRSAAVIEIDDQAIKALEKRIYK